MKLHNYYNNTSFSNCPCLYLYWDLCFFAWLVSYHRVSFFHFAGLPEISFDHELLQYLFIWGCLNLSPFYLRNRERLCICSHLLIHSPKTWSGSNAKTKSWKFNPGLPGTWLEPSLLPSRSALNRKQEAGARAGSWTQALSWTWIFLASILINHYAKCLPFSLTFERQFCCL